MARAMVCTRTRTVHGGNSKRGMLIDKKTPVSDPRENVVVEAKHLISSLRHCILRLIHHASPAPSAESGGVYEWPMLSIPCAGDDSVDIRDRPDNLSYFA
mmetsp:Transcript_81777/g.236282  ORF Transcript_81777/g.236282 Transcript_81777/m.236282 type:complete len:100 (-) Transcript_81777:347-646(-)